VTWLDLHGSGVTVSPSPLETDRFGVSVARVVVGLDAAWDDSLAGALTAACARAEDVLVVRWSSGLVRCGAVLAASGRDVVPADTLVYWEAATDRLTDVGRDLADDLRVRRAATDPAELDRLVAGVFGGYVNHYTANPLLAPDLALAGYVDWVRRTAQDDPDGVGVLAHGDEKVGVATWFVDPAGDFVEILLAGLVPEARGHGWYAALLAEVGRVAAGSGVPRVVISTQAANVAVQRAWVSAGFKPFAALTTVHAVRRGLLAGTRGSRD
jgi:GNAT superfamily N-acetyltransferase